MQLHNFSETGKNVITVHGMLSMLLTVLAHKMSMLLTVLAHKLFASWNRPFGSVSVLFYWENVFLNLRRKRC